MSPDVDKLADELLELVRQNTRDEIHTYNALAAVLRLAIGKRDWGIVVKAKDICAEMGADLAEALAQNS